MKKGLFWSSVLILAVFSIWPVAWRQTEDETLTASKPVKTLQERYRYALERQAFEERILRNPFTGEIPAGIKQRQRAFAKNAPVRLRAGKTTTFRPRGPENLGGRTRAIAFDLSDPTGRTIIAGGVSSGVFRTTDRGKSWRKVSEIDDIHSVTTIAQDPTRLHVWYYGTGEALGSVRRWGDGIWKSTNGGLSWFPLEATRSAVAENLDSSFDLIHKLAVDPTTGYVYAAVHRKLLRSTDGGDHWDEVLTTVTPISIFAGLTDVVIKPSGGGIYASFHGRSLDDMEGVWFSPSGDVDSWTKIAGAGAADSPDSWASPLTYGRIVLAVPPTSEHILYALYDNGHFNACEGGETRPEADLFAYDSNRGVWLDLSANLPHEEGRCLSGNNPFSVQSGYDMALSVSPINPNVVVIGGTNLYRSESGFANESATRQIGGYGSSRNYSLYPDHHPDIHTVVFDPFNPNQVFTGSDGGIHEAFIGDTLPSWTSLNNGYVTFQYYHVALSPLPGETLVMGGAQDNGTTIGVSGRDHEEFFGGDGVAVGIGNEFRDGANAAIFYFGTQLGAIFRFHTLDGFDDIKPNGAGDGMFVTYFYLDPDNTDNLYYANDNRLFRTATARTVNASSWTEMTGVANAVGSIQDQTVNIFSMAVTRGPYTPESKLYIGDFAGRIFRLVDPLGVLPEAEPVEITPRGAVAQFGSVVSALAVDPLDDRVLLAVYSNFGIPGVFVTMDGGETWVDVQGNLEFPSKRSAAIINIDGQREYLVGTSYGLWSTHQLDGAGTIWRREGISTIQSAVVTSMAYRPVDQTLLVGTHGNGMFEASFSANVGTRLSRTYHLPEVQADAGNRDTIIGVVNPDAQFLADIDLFAFSDDGQLLALSELHTMVGPLSRLRFSVKDAFPDHFAQIGWIQIGSDGELDVYAELTDIETRSAYKAPQQARRALMPHIAKDTGQFETVLSAVNSGPGESACQFLPHPGETGFDLNGVTTPFGRTSQNVTDFLGNDLIGGPDLWAEVDCSDVSLVAMEYFTRLPGRTQQAALGLNDQRGRTLNFLHVAADTNQFWTGMLYINIGDLTAQVTETFYDTAGNVLSVVERTLDPNEKATLLYDFANQVEVPAGTAWVRVVSNQDLIGYQLFGTPVISSNDTFTGLQGNYESGRILDYPHLVSDDEQFTGVVALNLGDSSADITFTAMAADGAELESVTIANVAPKTKLVRLVSTLFEQEQTRTQGAWIRATANGSEWAGFLLWGDKGADRQFLSGVNAGVRN